MKIAVVHDYFTQLGGAEKVAEELVRMLPTASLHTTVALAEFMPPGLAKTPVGTTWMQHLPLMKRLFRFYFLLYPWAVRSLDLLRYDLVITSSSGYVKGVKTGEHAVHVCYCHTPMRWAWSFDSYSSRGMGLTQRLLLLLVIPPLRRWDLRASRQPDHFVANSKTVAARIKRAYGREAEVIHPPIDLHRFRPAAEQEDYYLILARLVPYKRIDVAVEACTSLGRRLLVIGNGPDRVRLEAMAGPTVEFLGRLPDDEVQHYASRCRALIFPGEEDFGMAPLEIAVAGRPTIAFRAGGAIETIVEGVTGTFFDEQNATHLAAAIEQFETTRWFPEVLRSHAKNFSVEVFQARFLDFLSRIGTPVPEQHRFSAAKASSSLDDTSVPFQSESLTA